MILLLIVVAALALLSLCALAGLLRSGQLREACLPPKTGELRVDDDLAAMLDRGAT